MSCCGPGANYNEVDEVSRFVAGRLAAFLATLRDSGFAVGLREGQDAASVMTSGYAARPNLLRSAFKHLFSVRKADWDKFDGLFDAFWLGKRLRSRSITSGSVVTRTSPRSAPRRQTVAEPCPARANPGSSWR